MSTQNAEPSLSNPAHPVPVSGPSIQFQMTGETPLDFIKSNMAAQGIKVPDTQINPQEMINNASPTPIKPADPLPEISLFAKTEVTPNVPNPSDAPTSSDISKQPLDAAPVQEELLPEDIETQDEKAKANWKRLTKKTKETERERNEALAERDTWKNKATALEKGEVAPEVVHRLNERIAKLEPYEKVFNLRASPGYNEKVIKPLEQLTGRLGKIADDYGIPSDLLQEATQLTNERELNQFLENHFDGVGALEVKGLIKQFQDVETTRHALEQEPVAALQQLNSDFERAEAIRRTQKAEAFEAKATTSLHKAFDKIKGEGKAHELILRPNDSEFNSKFVQPVQQKVGEEYGKLIVALSQAGLQDLPDSLADGLAEMVARAIGHAVAVETRSGAEQHAAALQKTLTRSHNILRPNAGSSNGTTGSPSVAQPKPMDAAQAADAALNKALTRR